MCEQLKTLEKIRTKGEVNGYGLELAEAQAMDYMRLDKKVANIEQKVVASEKRQIRQGKVLSRLEGQVDLIVKRLNSPVEDERKDAIFWQQVKSIGKTTSGKLILLLIVGCIALSGQRILELLGLIQ